jgi:hypothetical protein
MTATIKTIERDLKIGEWVELDPHKNRPSILIKGSAWRVESFNILKQTCQISNGKNRIETLEFDEISNSSPYRKTNIVQLKSDPRYIGRVVFCQGDKIRVEWAIGGKQEVINSDKLRLFIQMVRGYQMLLGEYLFKEGDHVKTTDKNFGNVILTVKECFPSGMVSLKSSNDPDLLLPGCGLTIVEEGF